MEENKPKFLPVNEIIELGKEAGVDFGTGKPYNRLRYYTKLGWLPHMERMGKNVKGHYPDWVIDRLKLIQKLKNKGYNNDQITEEIEKQKRIKELTKPLTKKEFRRKLLVIISLILLGIIILNELEVIKIGKSKQDLLLQLERSQSIFP